MALPQPKPPRDKTPAEPGEEAEDRDDLTEPAGAALIVDEEPLTEHDFDPGNHV
jgi:hypothetical protein